MNTTEPRFLDLPGCRLAYEDHGQGLPVLFIHGFPLNRRLWRPQAAGLSDQARLILPDLRGFGASGAPSGPYAMDLLADDCINLLDALEIHQPAVVCGLSMGGYVAFALYRRCPERVSALILTATRAGAETPEGKANRDKAAALVQVSGASAIARAMLPKMFAPENFTARPDLVALARGMMESASVTGIVGALQGMRDRPDATPLLAQITCPTLLLYGAADQFILPAEIQAMQTAIPASRRVILPDAGHLPNLEQPELFNQAVRSFLDRLPRS